MFQILIVVLIVILVLLIGIVWYQRLAVKKINNLRVASQDLANRHLDDQLAAAAKMQLVGDSKDELANIQKRYDEQFKPAVKALLPQGEELLAAVKTSQLLTINSAISDYQTAINQADSLAKRLQGSLQKLQGQEKRHHQAVADIDRQYRHFHQLLDTKGFTFGTAVQQLNDQLDELEKRFAKFTDLTNKGDLEAAGEILAALQPDNEKFANLLDTVPKLYKPLVAEFPDQLNELQSGYQTLTKQHYNFTEPDLDQKIDQLQAKLKQTVKQLDDLQTDVVATSNKELAAEIDKLYAVMQKELDAKPVADHLMKVLAKFIPHAQQQNEELTAELKRLNLSYTFNNNEIESARHLGERIKTVSQAYQQDAKSVKEQTAVYSQIASTEADNQKELTAVEKKQSEINDEVAKLQTDEQRARKMLQKYSTDLRTIRRQVKQLNLPGVSQDYVDYFEGVSSEVERLAAELNQYKVNMDDVTKQLIVVEADLENLRSKTSDLHDSAELTERLLQYANRFTDNQKVGKAAEEAQQLFAKHQYDKSLEKIGTALEEVEPGSFKRIEDSYYNENR